MTHPLKFPAPYAGGKSSIAHVVWEALGSPNHYIEPFVGSAAVLLAKPDGPAPVETVNDADGLLVNVWRALRYNPDAVWREIDGVPPMSLEVTARAKRIRARAPGVVGRLADNPEANDPILAADWIYGACCTIGTDWTRGMDLGRPPKGALGALHGLLEERVPALHISGSGNGVHAAIPGGEAVTALHLSRSRGVYAAHYSGANEPGITNVPSLHVGDAGRGINAALSLHRPGNGDAEARSEALRNWFQALSARLSRVRIRYGDWAKVLTPAVLSANGGTIGVFLDPPYDDGESWQYAGGVGCAPAVAVWAREHGQDPRFRIVLAGHFGDHDLPGWKVHRWSRQGGYGSQAEGGNKDRHRECLWLSPHCVGREDALASKPMRVDLWGTQ